MLRCEDLLGTKAVSTYYEFLFVMALAAECGRRGTSLDVRNIRILDKDMLSSDDLDYMRYLKEIGSLYDGSKDCGIYERNSDEDKVEKRPKYYIDVDSITALYSKLFEDREDCYYWCTDYAFKEYDTYANSLLHKKQIDNTILHLTAHMLVCFKFGERKQKLIKFYFKNLEVKTIYMYLTLLACSRSIPTLKGIVEIDLDKVYIDSIGDIDFNILYGTAIHAKRIKKWSCDEKFKAFHKYGFQKGSIAVLYERGRMSESNKIGSIVRASIIRIDDYNEDLYSRAGWKVTKFSVNKTIEEMEDDYYGIDEEYRDAFVDLLNPSLGRNTSFLSFETVGIGTYFSDEEYIMMPIERDEIVQKKVSIDGKTAIVELDDVDTIYWILNQYGVDFDKDLYKKYYNDGKPLKWDMYDCTPVRRVLTDSSESDYNNYID